MAGFPNPEKGRSSDRANVGSIWQSQNQLLPTPKDEWSGVKAVLAVKLRCWYGVEDAPTHKVKVSKVINSHAKDGTRDSFAKYKQLRTPRPS